MRIVKIKNKYLFDSDNPEGVHSYAVYVDKKTGEVRAVALTHLYLKDEKRFKQVKRGNIRQMKLPGFELPSGVQNYYYTETVDGGKIDLLSKNIVSVSRRHLPKFISDAIKKFARKRKNGKKNSHK